MKPILVALMLCASIPARAQTPADAYLAARDKAITALAPVEGKEPTAADDARETRALKTLLPLLRAAVGPIGLRGFPAQGESNVDALTPGTDFGKLDGVAAKSRDGKTTVLVTTVPLLRAWLAGHRDWWKGDADNPPQDMAAAFASDGFITQAFSNDARATKFADIPVVRADAIVGAMLFIFSQDQIAPNTPDEIAVSVALGDKVFVFTQPTRTASIPECKTAFDRAHVATEAVLKHYQASGAKDDALFETYTKMGEADDAAFIRCYGEHVATQAFYPALVRQAQALADLPQAGK
jgi:hypothetical protein